jgi:hypothetical protein
MGFGRVQRVFLTIWSVRKQYEAMQYVAIMGHVFSSMVKSLAENGVDVEA